ncbi:14819_t:CDS:2 [Cetraspora pellucida]|uniref:14819_t:CDS:1 n=1 Tax=Cetraspora pellucida TaxID=1433469 RepID=A0ACA9JVU4_9GLOM|nr:14819_t:CDS:2 [Cetraspora pellucida]
MRQNFDHVDPTQLIGCVNSPNSAITKMAFFEILLDPFLLIGLNESFVDILVHFKDDESFKLTNCYGTTKTREMEEFQNCNYFTTSIEVILQSLKDFNKSPRKDTI